MTACGDARWCCRYECPVVLARNETAEALAGLSHARATCACWIGSKGICFAVGYSTSDVCVWGVPPPIQQGQSPSLCSIKAYISCFSADSWTQAAPTQLPSEVACLLGVTGYIILYLGLVGGYTVGSQSPHTRRCPPSQSAVSLLHVRS